MKYKQNKSVFMEQIKFFLANDMKFLQNEAFYYLKDEEVSPQKVSKKKTQLIYLTNEMYTSQSIFLQWILERTQSHHLQIRVREVEPHRLPISGRDAKWQEELEEFGIVAASP